MKKIIKNILITIPIVYLIITTIMFGALAYTTYYFIYGTFAGEYENIRDVSQQVQDTTNSRIEELVETETLKTDYPTLGVAVIQNNTSVIINVINMFVYSLIISLIVGIAMGTMISLTEKSKDKLIFKFITGAIIIDISIVMLLNSKNFFEEFFYVFQSTIIIYTIIFSILFFIKLLYKKYKLKRLNKKENNL